MNRNIEFIILGVIIASMFILGVTAFVLVNAEQEPEHEDDHEQEHELGHEHEQDDPIEEFLHHVSNWMIWLIFGITLAVGIGIYMYFNKK